MPKTSALQMVQRFFIFTVLTVNISEIISYSSFDPDYLLFLPPKQ